MNIFASDLLDFINKSPSPFHVVHNVAAVLEKAGFICLDEKDKWQLDAGKNYYVKRNDSAVIAFSLPVVKEYKGFRIAASHSDSPVFKVKENPEIKTAGNVVKLNVEKYGGMLCAPWFDRPLGVAGRVFVEENGSVVEKLYDSGNAVCLIPSLAIHMCRDANDGASYNVQNHMLPVFCGSSSDGQNDGCSLLGMVAEKLDIKKDAVISHDLFLYNCDKGSFWGSGREFIASPKLDDLECVYVNTMALVDAMGSKKDSSCVNESEYVLMDAVFDNEETGSLTRQGADSTFMRETMERINAALGFAHEEIFVKYANSFLISADNGHAVHPNYTEKSDPVNRPEVNGGPVLKFNGNQKYCTDGYSAAVFKQLCKKADVPCQVYTNRSDMAGGSTLGNISQAQVSIPSVDVGLAQWAMHSCMESGGAKDPEMLYKVMVEFFRS